MRWVMFAGLCWVFLTAASGEAASIDAEVVVDFFREGKWLPAIGGVLTLLVLGARRIGLSRLVSPRLQGIVNTLLTGGLTVASAMVLEADWSVLISSTLSSIAAPLLTHFVSSDKDTEARE